MTPLPPFEGGGRGGILGGNGPFLSAYSKNPEGGLLFIDHLTSPETLKENMAVYSLPSVLDATYDEAARAEGGPYAAELKQAIEQAQPRPVSPVYPQISQAIYENVNKALAGSMSPEDALAKGQDQIERRSRRSDMLSLLIVGAGSRGATFADWARRHPGEARVAPSPSPATPTATGSATSTASRRRAASATGGGGRGRPDRRRRRDRHARPRPCRAGARAGGAGLRAADREAARPERGGVRPDRRRLERAGVVAAVAHVLRYTPYTRLLKRCSTPGGRRDRQHRPSRAGRLLAPGPLLRPRQLAPGGQDRADAAGQVLPRPRLALAT